MGLTSPETPVCGAIIPTKPKNHIGIAGRKKGNAVARTQLAGAVLGAVLGLVAHPTGAKQLAGLWRTRQAGLWSQGHPCGAQLPPAAKQQGEARGPEALACGARPSTTTKGDTSRRPQGHPPAAGCTRPRPVRTTPFTNERVDAFDILRLSTEPCVHERFYM